MSNTPPNQPGLQALRCPSCGAALPDGGARVECAFCGTTVDVGQIKRAMSAPSAAPGAARKPAAGRQPVFVSMSTGAARRRGRGLGCVSAIISLVVMGVAAATFFSAIPTSLVSPVSVSLPKAPQISIPSLPDVWLTDRMVLIPPDDAPAGTLPKAVALARGREDSKYHLALLDVGSKRLEWVGPDLSEQALSYGSIAVQGDTVLFSDDRTLLAFSLADGKKRWSATLSDRVCRGCLVTAGKSAVAMTVDYRMQGVDLKTGEVAWTYDLGGYADDYVRVVDGLVMVFARDKSSDLEVLQLSPDDGSVARRFTPECGNEVLSERMQKASTGDKRWVDEASHTLVLFSSFGDSCLHAYDLQTGERRWQAPMADADSSFANGLAFARAGDELLLGGPGQLYAASLATGKVRQVVSDEEHQFLPLMARDGVAAVVTVRQRGTQRVELWGVELQSGERLWRREFKGDGRMMSPPLEASGTVSKGDEVWDWIPTKAGLSLVTLTSDPHQYTVESVGLKDGAVASTQTIGQPEASAVWVPDMLARDGGQLFLSDNEGMLVVDGEKGALVAQYP